MQAQQPGLNPLCHTCGQGALIKRKKFRLSGPVVAIGFVLLIPSALGMLFGVLMLAVAQSASKSASAAGEGRIRAQLVAQNVPEPIISEIVSGKSVSDTQLLPLTYQQQTAVHEAEAARLGQKIGGGAATAIFGGLFIFIIVASFVGGLPWLAPHHAQTSAPVCAVRSDCSSLMKSSMWVRFSPGTFYLVTEQVIGQKSEPNQNRQQAIFCSQRSTFLP
jgi:hypothetical protein